MSQPSTPKNYSHEDDLSLIRSYRSGDELACTTLITRYAVLINSRTSRYHISSIELDDIKQEAYMGLLSAIRTFDETKGAAFSTYANSCVSNRLKNLLASATTKKSELYKGIISFDEKENSAFTGSNSHNPESLFIQNEEYADLRSLISKHLSAFEKQVLFLYLSGCNYVTLAKLLGTDEKSVDNALQRGRKKLKAVLNNL